ncbi:hypothetical protein JL722_9823 [Aureococcus anophagefferens]|nr:hypothetical protein JL722_9823 [Aureococcus anophagefferens]
MMKFSLHIAPGSSSGSQRAQPLPPSGRAIMSVLKQPLVPQRQRATPRRLTTEPAKGGKELAESKAALRRVGLEIAALRQRKQPANGTPAAQLDALMQSYYAKARHLIDLIAPDLFKSDDDLFKEFNNMDAVEAAVLEVQEESLKVLRGEVSFGEAAQTTALASLASSRGASLPDLVKEFEHHLSIVIEDRREQRARYDQHVLKNGRTGVDTTTGKRRHLSGDEIQAERERQKKYCADEKRRAIADSKRVLHAARVEESHDATVDVPPGIERRTEGRYAIRGHIALEAGADFDNTPSADLATVVARLEQARALAGMKERTPPTLPVGVAKREDGKFSTYFRHASGQVSLRSFGRVVHYDTAEEAAAALAEFRAASAEDQKAMVSAQLKCCKCGKKFKAIRKGQRARAQAKERLEDHEGTCTVCPAPTL